MFRVTRCLSAVLLCVGATALGLPTAMAADNAMLRLAHLSPDTPAVDVYVDSVSDPDAGIVLPGVGYGSISDYQDVAPGTYTVAMRAAGDDPATPPVLSTTVDVGAGSARTVAGVGYFADLGLTVLEDDLTLPPSGQARMRVVAAAAGAGTLDVSRRGGPDLATGLEFAATTDYVDVPAGPTGLRVSADGGTAIELPLEVAAGSVYSVLVLDQPGGGLAVRSVLDAAGPGTVPVGGIETGAGGTAPTSAGGLGLARVAALGIAALAAAGLIATGRNRLPRRGTAARRDRRGLLRNRMGSHRAPGRAGPTAVRRVLASGTLMAGALAVLAPSPGPAPSPAAATARPVALQADVRTSVAVPTRVQVPSLGVDSSLVPLDVDAAGTLVPPTVFDQAGWFTGGPAPGDVGPAVVAGHVDSRTGPAVFFRLAEIAVGDEVLVDRADGTTVRFIVTRVTQHPKNAFPTTEVYGPTTGPELRLITCGGKFDRSTGSYLDNVVVWAVAG